MATKYIPYYPDTLEGQALLDNFVRTRRILRYRDNNRIEAHIKRGMPLYEVDTLEKKGDNPQRNLIMHGECLATCAYLKEQGIEVDLVYIDPPFASGADYAKKIYIRRNPLVQKAMKEAEQNLDNTEMKEFEEKMYGDIWDKERYLNWMYENLMAIKSVMSENASIYVHLDWHIVHYVKILMDEIFGEENFRNDISWHYSGWNKKLKAGFEKRHDTILFYCKDDDGNNFNSYFETYESEEDYIKRRKQKPLMDENGRKYVLSDAGNGNRVRRYVDEAVEEGVVVDDVWDIDKLNNSAKEAVDYATQKPEALLERIIKASSNEGMLVADFFGGSGVTAAVAHKLNRRFIHGDVNINSLQTARDRLVNIGAEFEIKEVKDGVRLFRNPVQTMDKLKNCLIPGLNANAGLDAQYWAGSITSSKYGMMPVYLPNLLDGSKRVLDKSEMMNIIHKALPDLPDEVKRVIVYYVDVEDIGELRQFIHDENQQTLIEFELRDLKQVLDEVVMEDEVEWNLEQAQDGLLMGWRVTIKSFHSDHVRSKVEDFNQKGFQQYLKKSANGKESAYQRIELSNEGLECVEWLSLDCTHAGKDAPWHSDVEIKIEKAGTVTQDGHKTDALWDATIFSEQKPLRMKVRSICGDETMVSLS